MPDSGQPPAEAPQVDLGPLEESLGFLLRLAQLRTFDDFFRSLGGELRPGEFSVLAIIDRTPGIRQGLLAQHLFIKRAHMTKLVRGLVEAGLVERRVPEADRRAIELSLTQKGRALVRDKGPAFFAHGLTPSENLTAAEHDELVRLLKRYIGLGSS